MLQESQFHRVADAFLERLAEQLEAQDAAGEMDVDLLSGILTITFAGGAQLVVSKHAPSMQLWFSSPLSGGLHFSYDEAGAGWILKDGRGLEDALMADMKALQR